MPLVGSLILAITLIVGMFYWLSPKQTVQAISKEEAQATIEQLYNGKVTKIKETTNNYVLTVEMDNGIYEVKVNSTDGKVHSLKLLSQTESEAKQKLLSKEEVETIIKKNDVGTIESIVLQENETNPTYQVTVNHPDEKVIYFVSAFNGEVSKKRIEQQQKNNDI